MNNLIQLYNYLHQIFTAIYKHMAFYLNSVTISSFFPTFVRQSSITPIRKICYGKNQQRISQPLRIGARR